MPLSGSTQNALLLSPHPDDESLGCGGTVKLITQSGGIVDVAYMTRGDRGAFPGVTLPPEARAKLGAARTEEAKRACEVLGVRNTYFAGGRDGELANSPDPGPVIAKLLKENSYRAVFCPWPYDGHGDHVATYRILHRALASLDREVDVWLYEVWSPLPHNICIAIDQTMDAKMAAFAEHKSQAALLSYAEAFRGLAMFRALHRPPARFAEAFYTCTSGALLRHERLPWPAPAVG